MYEWLSDALEGGGTAVTANRRLARELQAQFVRQRLDAGENAWQSPRILAWRDWLIDTLRFSSQQESLPTIINQHQSRVLWERCLLKELPDSGPGVAGLIRLSRDAWQRLADWQVSIREVARSAQNDDQRLFATVAGRYLGILERQSWVDDAGLAALVVEEIAAGRSEITGPVTLAGFERERPVVTALHDALRQRGVRVESAPLPDTARRVCLQKYDNLEAEMRAAGAWAREQLQASPDCSIAIIASDLEQQATSRSRLVREGLIPGWQYASIDLRQALNVSYGRRLTDFPAIAVALLLLRWIVGDLSSSHIGQLLRSPLIGTGGMGSRSRLELRLRKLPDRRWSPSMLSAALRSADTRDASDWGSIVARLSKLRRDIARTRSPADWAGFIDETLRDCGWPGQAALDSSDFQLVNRWRDLLNDFARLDLVTPAMSLKTAVQRLEQMAADTIFQAETQQRGVQLIGPLEAAGAEFDAIWVCGLTAAHWPAAGNPSPLLSRRLQREHRMPDATPTDTVHYASNLLQRLGRSAPDVTCSYPSTEDDAEQSPSTLLRLLQPVEEDAVVDPGWHAASLTKARKTILAGDPVPPMQTGERVAGGATTIQLQLSDPAAAFITGRLGVKRLQTQAVGVPAAVRGNIIHDALYRLYLDKPSRSDVENWSDDDLHARLTGALQQAFGRHERHSDKVLHELLALERQRMKTLLRRFVELDSARADFDVIEVEHELAFSSASVSLQLRVDRIERYADGTLGVIDYKSGAHRKLLQADGEPREIQLVAYAYALDGRVSSLALANIDSREVAFEGAGRGYDEPDDWDDRLGTWVQSVIQACDELSGGDVRLNAARGVTDARPLNLLTRFTELRRDS